MAKHAPSLGQIDRISFVTLSAETTCRTSYDPRFALPCHSQGPLSFREFLNSLASDRDLTSCLVVWKNPSVEVG